MPSVTGWMIILSPVVLGVFLVVLLRHHTVSRMPLQGMRIVLPAMLFVALGSRFALDREWLGPAVVNRTAAALSVLIVVGFLAVNATRQTGLARVAVWCVAVGSAMNATVTFVVGYMPALESAAKIAGYDTPLPYHPYPKYVVSDDMSLIAILMGDFIPIPGLVKVVSIGDLLLVAGAAVLLALVLAAAWRPGVQSQDQVTSSGAREDRDT